MRTEFTTEAMKGTPAVAGAVASVLTLNQWIAIGTAFYIVVQVLYLLRKWWREEADYVAQTRRDEAMDRRDAAMDRRDQAQDRRDASADREAAQQPQRRGAANDRREAGK